MGAGYKYYSIGGVGDEDDVDGEGKEDVSKANNLASEASKLSAGARILGALKF